MKYYIIERTYVGADQDSAERIDADRIEISTKPAKKNQTHEVCATGWCGTTNNWSVYAHGEYDSIEAARAAVMELYGPVRAIDVDEVDVDGTTVAAYKRGEYAPMSNDDIWDIVANSAIGADTTDDDLNIMASEIISEMQAGGYDVGFEAVMGLLREARDEERDLDDEG